MEQRKQLEGLPKLIGDHLLMQLDTRQFLDRRHLDRVSYDLAEAIENRYELVQR